MTVETLAADYAATRARMDAITAKIAALRTEFSGQVAKYDALGRRLADGEDVPDDDFEAVELELAAIKRRLSRYELALRHLGVDVGKLAVQALPLAALAQEPAGNA